MSLAAVDLEGLLTGAGFARLPASPLQRAICRASEGLPLGDLLTDEQIEQHFGAVPLVGVVPQIVELVAGVRGGKSYVSATAALRCAFRADCSRLQRHEQPRVSVIAPTLDAASATFALLLGIVESSPLLRAALVGKPSSEALVIRRPDGRTVEITVVAASRGGVSVRNRWLAGFVLDELAQIGTETTGAVVSAEEIFRAASTRLLPLGQGWLISSPYGPAGLLWSLYKAHFGHPSARFLIVHAPTRAMNPSFPQEQIDLIAAEDPDVARREYGAEWVDADQILIESTILEAVVRPAPLVALPPRGATVVVGGDFGTRGNSTTLAVGWRSGDRCVIGGAWQWTGSKAAPLSPELVIA